MEQISVNMDNLNQEERNQLMALIQKGNKKQWEGPEFKYFIGGRGVITPEEYVTGSYREEYKKSGFFSDTEKKAEYIRDQLQHYAWMLHAWLEIVGDWRPDWLKNDVKYTIPYKQQGDLFEIDAWTTLKYNGFYFQNKKQAEKFIELVGDRLKELGK